MTKHRQGSSDTRSTSEQSQEPCRESLVVFPPLGLQVLRPPAAGMHPVLNLAPSSISCDRMLVQNEEPFGKVATAKKKGPRLLGAVVQFQPPAGRSSTEP